jgi:hypothetical protein
MTRWPIWFAATTVFFLGCGSTSSGTSGTGGSGASGAAGATGGAGTTGVAGTTGGGGGAGMAGTTGGAGTVGTAGTSGAGGRGGGSAGSTGSGGAAAPPCDQVLALVQAYKAAHPGNGGKDWDINAKTPAQIAADPAAQQLLALCGPGQRPVIPLIAWEYGGNDHQWINPNASALVYCVYIPVAPQTSHWMYDAAMDHVTADVSIQCPDQNPCKNDTGANQVANCIGDVTNFEILVDTASLHDGNDVGLDVSNASTELLLILANGSKVHLYSNL